MIKKLYLILLLLVISACSLKIKSEIVDKKTRIDKMNQAKDRSEGFKPYSSIPNSLLPTEYQNKYATQIDEDIKASIYRLLSDSAFLISEKYILENEESTECYYPEKLLEGTTKKEDIVDYLNSFNYLKKRINKMIDIDKNLYHVIIYSRIDEIHLLDINLQNTDAKRKECDNKNRIPLRVLDALFFENVKSNSVSNKVGFSMNKYSYMVVIPITYKEQYICDMLFAYLNEK